MSRVECFVIGDRSLNMAQGRSVGGRFVRYLEDIRPPLMRPPQPRADPWILVLRIHGSVDLLSTSGAVVRIYNQTGQVVNLPQGVRVYRAQDIRRIFQDQAFVNWRNMAGPSWVSLNACQVNAQFEATVIQALSRPGSTQPAYGLGTGCRPDLRIESYVVSDTEITTRQQYARLSRAEQNRMAQTLQDLNRTEGYFGAPPVPPQQVLDYYFDEIPRGGWPTVGVTHNRQPIGRVPFYNRGAPGNTQFLQQCDQGVGRLRPHVPSAPPVRH